MILTSEALAAGAVVVRHQVDAGCPVLALIGAIVEIDIAILALPARLARALVVPVQVLAGQRILAGLALALVRI